MTFIFQIKYGKATNIDKIILKSIWNLDTIID